MAVTSGFFSSLNGDRKYSAKQFSALIDNLVTDGVFANVGTAFEVKVSSDNAVTVGIGRAWFNSIWVYNDTLYPMAVQDPEVLLNRIDAIVIEINHNEAVRTGSIRWVYGSPSSSPSRPNLTNTNEVHQYPLAYVLRKAGRSSVIQADITNAIGTSECPYVTGILSTQNIDKIVAQWESQFTAWFDGLDAALSGDVAANLANQMLDLQGRFQTLARDKAVYEALQDSSGAVIQDHSGGDILGKTVFSGGDNVIINYNSSQGGNGDSAFKVGDILSTARNDLDDKWLLCNGDLVDAGVYSELASVCPPGPFGNYVEKLIASGSSCKITGSLYVNGAYVIVGYYSSRYGFIAVSTNPASGWTTYRPFATNQVPVGIVYKDGYYVIPTREYESSYTNIIYWSQTLSGSGWSSYQYPGGYEFRGIACSSNYIVILAWYAEGYTPYILYATSVGTSWSVKSIGADSGSTDCIRYLNGEFVVCKDRYFYTATNPGGTWTKKDSGISMTIEAGDVAYTNGYYIVTTSSNARIFYGKSLSGPFSEAEVLYDGPSGYEYYGGISVEDGMVCVAATLYGDLYLLYSVSPAGPYVPYEILKGTAVYKSSTCRPYFILNNGSYAAAGFYTGSDTYEIYSYGVAKTSIKLPEITLGGGAYSYIRAKE